MPRRIKLYSLSLTVFCTVAYGWMYFVLVRRIPDNMPLVFMLIFAYAFSMYYLWRARTWVRPLNTQPLPIDKSTDDAPYET